MKPNTSQIKCIPAIEPVFPEMHLLQQDLPVHTTELLSHIQYTYQSCLGGHITPKENPRKEEKKILEKKNSPLYQVSCSLFIFYFLPLTQCTSIVNSYTPYRFTNFGRKKKIERKGRPGNTVLLHVNRHSTLLASDVCYGTGD